MRTALNIWVKGIVQGVGFRPFVYRLAKRHLIQGWVLNGADGVHVHAEGDERLVDEFVLAISEEAPAAAQVTEIEMHEVPLEGFDRFEIRTSDEADAQERTLVSPDLATCADCQRELFDPADRRFRYPFINCTNCGPRFTIIDDLPYDRAATSMRDFVMCDACAAEYADPADRRFHAQPDACFSCGPSLTFAYRQAEASSLIDPDLLASHPFDLDLADSAPSGSASAASARSDSAPSDLKIVRARTREETDAVFAAAVALLLAGRILAVKGLGGYHLVCDANNAEAVAELRRRKHRFGKAFAVMGEKVDDIRAFCQVSEAERRLLEGSQRPIVLLRKLPGVPTPLGIADGLPDLGAMLPYTPVQHLLLHDFAAASAARAAVPLLVMTSGNLHDEPIVIDDAEAYARLAGIADAFVGNDRQILSRYDDSVVRVLNTPAGEAIQFIRRARGYAPLPLVVAGASQEGCCFAAGPEQKNTFAFLRAGEAFVSQHIGDVENAETFDAWLHAKARYEKLFAFAPTQLACDLHPEYLTSKWANDQAAALGLPLAHVQHHHAHIVSAMAEHGLDDAVCGIAFDGTGYGPDGAIWGGEVLLANRSAFERFANFAYVPMPGGAACVKHPLRMAYGVLWEYDLLEHPAAATALAELGAEQQQVCEAMIENGLNTPYTSSVGRLFDAASALLGICTQPTYEGEPAIMLEAAMVDYAGDALASQATVARVAEPRVAAAHEEAARTEGAQAKATADASAYEIAVVKNTATAQSTAQDTSVVLFDAEPAFRALLDDLAAGVPVSCIAQRFHDAIVQAIVMAAQLVAATYDIRTVVLSGGVFMNRYLTEQTLARLQREGFTVAINRDLPPNDGCISFGQAVIASAL
ncbi:carbamoyltransferase HypF [Adlercreutzia murintestinalis]|uniref:carbamoyltransferase HypF n=1 Tax=Adlercreutzia murintestinalis TaxID=2941325 RepID=UPI00203CE07F|nr:carbamoyltransferase HypF [Adlercreutzia murintestinalis]